MSSVVLTSLFGLYQVRLLLAAQQPVFPREDFTGIRDHVFRDALTPDHSCLSLTRPSLSLSSLMLISLWRHTGVSTSCFNVDPCVPRFVHCCPLLLRVNGSHRSQITIRLVT